jgi:hypothetical protein
MLQWCLQGYPHLSVAGRVLSEQPGARAGGGGTRRPAERIARAARLCGWPGLAVGRLATSAPRLRCGPATVAPRPPGTLAHGVASWHHRPISATRPPHPPQCGPPENSVCCDDGELCWENSRCCKAAARCGTSECCRQGQSCCSSSTCCNADQLCLNSGCWPQGAPARAADNPPTAHSSRGAPAPSPCDDRNPEHTSPLPCRTSLVNGMAKPSTPSLSPQAPPRAAATGCAAPPRSASATTYAARGGGSSAAAAAVTPARRCA